MYNMLRPCCFDFLLAVCVACLQCYTFLAFIAAMMPPAHMGNLVMAGRTLLNILNAHTATYRVLKAMPGGKEAMIGLVHHHITFASRGNGVLHGVSG